MYIIVNGAQGGRIDAARKTQQNAIAYLQALAVEKDHTEIAQKVREASRGKFGYSTASFHCRNGSNSQVKIYRIEGEE